MAITDSITQARQKGASDDQIVQEILKQNPAKAATFQKAQSMGANSTHILDEILKQNGGGATPSLPDTAQQPNQPQAPLLDRVLNSGVSKGIQSFFPGAKLGEAIGTSAAVIGQVAKGNFGKGGAGDILKTQVPFQVQAGDAIGAMALPASLALGGGTGPTALSRIANAGLKYGLAGGATALGKSMTEQKSASGVLADTGKGFGVGSLLGGTVQGVTESLPFIQKGVNKLLSHTADTPEEAFKIITARPEAAQQIGDVSPEVALKNTQSAVRGLRTSLTQSWDDGVKVLADEYSGTRVGLSDKMVSLLSKVDEAAGGLQNVPQNPANMSVQELIKLQTEVNGIANKTAFKITPQGVPIRQLADQLKELGVNSFGGADGSYANFYSKYAAQKGVFDAANDIVQAYKTGKPITQTSALARLQHIFDANRPAYLEAMKELESATGKDILSQVAASKFQPILPKSPSVGGDIWTKALKMLTLPLTSPRGAAFLSQAVGGSSKIAPALRAGVNMALPAVASSVVAPQEQQQQLPKSSVDITTLSPEVQRVLKMRQ